MLAPFIQRPDRSTPHRYQERGVTMALVALAIVGMLAMAALSIDIGTLYQASAEAQRAADAAALAAARVISVSGITGDPSNSSSSWQPVCGGTSSAATLAADSVAQQNLIAGAAPSTTVVCYGTGSCTSASTNTDCAGAGTSFGVNPVVQVYVQQAKLPTFFARVFALIPNGTFANSGVSAMAAAEAYNPSGSGAGSSANTIPVQPHCVKPLIIPNIDPGNSPNPFVNTTDGSLANPGVFTLGGTGSIGEAFRMKADCKAGAPNCEVPANITNNPPIWTVGPPVLQYIPALVQGTPIAVPSCAAANPYQQAIGGCDQTTVYTCGTPATTSGATQADLTENPANPSYTGGDASTAIKCLIHQPAGGGAGEDTIDTGNFPFQMKAGDENPLVKDGLAHTGDVLSASGSIVTLPIADFGGTALVGTQPAVTIVGFLQVFVRDVSPFGANAGDINVTVLNLAGCSNNAGKLPVFGTSPVPIRLITPPVAATP